MMANGYLQQSENLHIQSHGAPLSGVSEEELSLLEITCEMRGQPGMLSRA